MPARNIPQTYEKKELMMALQGGGAHGAYTWGVLDRLLEIDELTISGLCGTSAGAVNAVLATYGYMQGGKPMARKYLNDFWEKLADLGDMSVVQPSMFDALWHPGEMYYSLGFQTIWRLKELMSPYQFNPLDINPLKSILLEMVDFEALSRYDETKLYIYATNVKTCKARIFKNKEITVEALMASACLPDVFKAVEIEGEHYWDGGYMGNPLLFPLIEGSKTEDILLVQINPIKIDKVPKSTREIQDRINEISFNSSLMWEMRIFNLKDKLVQRGETLDGKLRHINLHHLSADQALGHLKLSSKYNITRRFLYYLKACGRHYCEKWLRKNYNHIGVKSTCDIKATFL